MTEQASAPTTVEELDAAGQAEADAAAAAGAGDQAAASDGFPPDPAPVATDGSTASDAAALVAQAQELLGQAAAIIAEL